MSYRPSSVGLAANRGGLAASRPTILYPNPTRPGVWRTPEAIRAMRASRAMSGMGATAIESRGIRAMRGMRAVPMWYAPGDLRATPAIRAARGLMGLLGLGTDVADPGGYVDPNSVIAPADTSNPIMTAVPVTTPAPVQAPISIATVPTQQSDGSMAPTPIWTTPAPVTSAPKKWYSFLETTKADGTVTGPLGMSWTTWLVGGSIAALVFANRGSSGSSSYEEESSEPSTPNRRRARKNSKKTRRNSRRRHSRRSR